MNTTMISNIVNLLKSDEEPKWQTAKTIALKLNSNLDSVSIEQILIDYYKGGANFKIRYSTLPSQNSLQVLWGHIDKVGNRKVFDIFREDEQVSANYLDNINDERNIFLSHSFKDSDRVFGLASELVKYGFNPWMAEADINQGHHINNEVINAINELPFFGIYLSKNVLQSTWSAKELEFAVRNKRKLFAFIGEGESEIIDLIENNIPISHFNVHDILIKLFDINEFSEQITFFVIIPKSEKTNTNLLKIKPLHIIQDYLL